MEGLINKIITMIKNHGKLKCNGKLNDIFLYETLLLNLKYQKISYFSLFVI